MGLASRIPNPTAPPDTTRRIPHEGGSRLLMAPHVAKRPHREEASHGHICVPVSSSFLLCIDEVEGLAEEIEQLERVAGRSVDSMSAFDDVLETGNVFIHDRGVLGRDYRVS